MSAITIKTIVRRDVGDVWRMWTTPADIQHWNHASEDWSCPYAENDLRVGGKFLFRMSANDGSTSFDFVGTYTDIQEHALIAYALEDGRKIHIVFESIDNTTKITEQFDPESENPLEMQRDGWQAILNNFKNHAERN